MTTAVLGAGGRSIIRGISSRTKSHSFFGTKGIPFIVSAALALGGGKAVYYGLCLNQALLALDNYPSLMLLHLDGK